MSHQLIKKPPIENNINTYNFILKNINDFINNNIYNKDKNLIFSTPTFPILVNNVIDINYYRDIYKYLFIKNNNIENLDRSSIRNN